MLTITQTAAEAVDSIVASAPGPDTAGLRISQTTGEDGQPAFALALVAEPEPTDHVLDGQGEHASVFIESHAADLLDDKVLDARVMDNQVGFVIAERS